MSLPSGQPVFKTFVDGSFTVAFIDYFHAQSARRERDSFDEVLLAFKRNRTKAVAALLADVVSVSRRVFRDAGVDTVIPVVGSARCEQSDGTALGRVAISVAAQLSSDCDMSIVRQTGPRRTLHAGYYDYTKRRAIVRSTLTVSPKCAGKRVLLIDDVVTTQATLSIYREALKDAGATIVGASVIGKYDRYRRFAALNPRRYDDLRTFPDTGAA